MTSAKLKSGLVVGNFASPHDFVFDDGTVLPAVSKHDTYNRSVDVHEERILELGMHGKYIYRLRLWYSMAPDTMDVLEALDNDESHDIVLVSMTTILAMKSNGVWVDDAPTRIRGCYMPDRVSKIVSSTEFCW